MNTVTVPNDMIRNIGGFLEEANLYNFGLVCKAAKKALEILVNYKIASFQQVFAEYFQNVPNFLDPNYPHIVPMLDSVRDNEGFLPDFEADLLDRRNGIGKNSVKFLLKEAGELYKDQPEALYKAYKMANNKIKLLKTPLSISKKLEISFIKIDRGIDKAKQRMNDFLGESFKQISITADRTNTFIHENPHQIAIITTVTAIVGQILY